MSNFFKNCRRLLSDVPSRLSTAGITSTDSCDNCHVNFNIIRKKRVCAKCLRLFCGDCLPKREASCRPCAVLSSWPVFRSQLLELRPRDIKAFLTANGVSTHGCVEKEELVDVALRFLGRRHQVPAPSPRVVSTNIVDDAWVLVSDQEEPSPPPRSEPVPVAERVSIVVSDSLSSSLPPLSSLDEVKAASSSLSESQPNLAATPQADEATGSGAPLAASQTSVDNPLLAMSRTDLAAVTEAELEKLSIKNLKVLLTKHRVDYRGCCEKEELLERVRRLRQQLQAQAKIDVGQLSDENLCKVCMAAPIDCVLLDCGHLVACTPCGKQMSECPVCRQYVVRVVKTFRA